jgi:hypothetical protein
MTFRRAVVSSLLLVAVLGAGCGAESGGQGQAALVAQARQVVEDIDAARYGELRERFDDNLMKMLSEDQLAKAWDVFTNVKGDFESISSTEVVERGRFTVVNVLVDMERENGQVRVSFDNDGKVAGFFLLNTGVPVPDR